MSSLKEIKGRIASVQSTQKITSAMRMVASAKLHRTQQMTQTFVEYINEMQDIISSLGGIGKAEARKDAARVVLVPVSSGSGLCGAFNSNIAKAAKAAIEDYKAQGAEVQVIPIGKKVAHELRDMECNMDFNLIGEHIGKDDAFAECCRLMAYLQKLVKEGEADEVVFIYHHFKSMGSQVICHESLDMLPPQLNDSEDTQTGGDYITEPSPEQLIAELHPKMLNGKVYGILLDSVTSEHAARMLAMQTADDNAKELLQELTLQYNKSRQQAITNELIDIMGGKVAQ
ncbi:MAG: ATP synthase F1 subunit gamma [Bacteroidaceae bacterium]|nr:ATP synthase F1 subunit gamma [Bacteroidaceae bacterium]